MEKPGERPRIVVKTNPQQHKYKWGKVDRISYTISDNQLLNGILYYPANYKPDRLYPMVVKIYETQFEYLHHYFSPTSYMPAGFSPTNYTTDGYFVLYPDIIYKVATRPEARIGSDESWDKAEAALIHSLDASGCAYELSPGEGAFYGPKIEYTLKDAIGRQWQCGTIQVDFSMPERLDAEFVGEDGNRHRPVMLHRAIVGSFERFIGILIEQYAGALPAWLAPVQVAVLNITDAQADYCREIAEKLEKAMPQHGLRVALDLRNEKITYKIREHSMQKLPFILVAGDKERAAGAVAVRARGNKDLGVMSVDAFIEHITQTIAAKA